MGFGRYSFLICFFILLVSPVIANECSKEDKEYADFGKITIHRKTLMPLG